MYERLGIHWAASIPAFLALACVPFPFIFYHYGPAIRARCKFAAEAALFLRKMQEMRSQAGPIEKVSDDPERGLSKHSALNSSEQVHQHSVDEDSKAKEAFDECQHP
jgi:hypothetical protein